MNDIRNMKYVLQYNSGGNLYKVYFPDMITLKIWVKESVNIEILRVFELTDITNSIKTE